MTLQTRDKRALMMLGAAAAMVLIWRFAFADREAETVVSGIEPVSLAEKRLVKAREMAGLVPRRDEALKQLAETLRDREKSIVQAETAAQAQARILQTVRKLASAQGIELKSVEIGQVHPYGDAYGEALVSVSFNCHIEQLLNWMAELTKQPEAISTSDFRVTASDAKEKTVGGRVTFSGLVERKLVPEKKGLAAF